MDKEYIVLEEISVMDLTIIGYPIARLGTVIHRGSANMKLENTIPYDATIVSRKRNQVEFQYNLDHGIVKMITLTLLPVND